MSQMRDLKSKPQYSPELLQIAEREALYELGVFLPDSPCLDENGKKTLAEYDSYMRERMQKMFGNLVLTDEETGQEKIGQNFLDDFEFLICDLNFPNAFIINKKYFSDKKYRVCITKGLLTFCQDKPALQSHMESVLVGVVGHEVGHAVYDVLKPEKDQTGKDEEAGADILSMAHMTNAGYHPKHLLNFFKELKKISHSRSLIDTIADEHPSLELRQDIQAGLLGVEEGLLDQLSQQTPKPFDEDLFQKIQNLPKINQQIYDHMASDMYQSLSPREQMLSLFRFLDTFEIPLYSDLDHYYNKQNSIWFSILKTHTNTNENYYGYEYTPHLDATVNQYRYNYINSKNFNNLPIPSNITLNEYMGVLKELYAEIHARELQSDAVHKEKQAQREKKEKSLWGRLTKPFRTEEPVEINPQSVYSTAYTIWWEWLSVVYHYQQKNEFTDENDSLYELHALIRQLMTSENYSNEIMQQISEHSDFKFLMRGSYSEHQQAGVFTTATQSLLNPYLEPFKEGEKLPFLPLIQNLAKEDPLTNSEETEYSYSLQAESFDKDKDYFNKKYWTYKDKIRPFLATMGVYDTQAFNAQLNKRYILKLMDGQSPVFGLKELSLTQEDYQKYAPYHVCFQLINKTIYEYHYSNDGTILSVEAHNSFMKSNWSIIMDKVVRYRQEVYKIKTEGLNTQLHFQICEKLANLQNAPVCMQTIEDLNSLIPYFYADEKFFDFSKLPLAHPDMNWKFEKSIVLYIDSEKYAKEREKYGSYQLFKFSDMTANTIIRKYIDVLAKVLDDYDKNPQNPETLHMLNAIRTSPCIWNFWRMQSDTNPLKYAEILKLLNHPMMREYVPETLKKYITRYDNGVCMIQYAPDLYYQLCNHSEAKSYADIVQLRKERNSMSVQVGSDEFQFLDVSYMTERLMFFADKNNDVPFEELPSVIERTNVTDIANVFDSFPELKARLKESFLHRILQFDTEENADDFTENLCLSVMLLHNHKLFERGEADEVILGFFKNIKADMLSMENMAERRLVLNLLPNGWVLDFVSNELLRWSDNPKETIWSGPIEEQIMTYNNLVYNNIFSPDGIVQREILVRLIDDLEKQPTDVREKLSFQLLAQRNPIEFIDLQQRVEQMWLSAVAENLNHQIDDRTSEFEEKIKQIADKLKNDVENTDKEFMENLPYTVLPIETQERLSSQLQDMILAQEQTAELLQVDAKSLSGILSDNKKIAGVGVGLETIYFILKEEPYYSHEIINFILSPNSMENAEAFHQLVGNIIRNKQSNFYHYIKDKMLTGQITLDDTQDVYNLMFSPEKWMRFHAQFWEKPFKIRTFLLANIFNHAEEHSYRRSQRMMHYILPSDMSNRPVFYDALRNYAQAVPEDESYRTDLLLAGCIASNKPSLKNQNVPMNMPQIIRLFLESQGAAGIKVGQFLSVQESLPKEVRDELLQLTNHAKTPSRAEVFETIRKYHPELIKTIRENPTGLGQVLGAASHFLTFELNENEVLSIARDKTDLEAQAVYKRLQEALNVTIIQHEEYADMLHIVQDAISTTRKMNKYELDANCGYLQMCIAQQLYDNVQMRIDGYEIDFRTMPWTKQPDAYCSVVTDGTVQYLQSYKIMEKAKGVDYTDIADESKSPEKTGIAIDMDEQKRMKKALAKANFLINLRAVMMGGAFDDDRHQGQLKVQLNTNKKLHVELFDTGSTSLTSPMRDEIKMLGSVFYRTLHGYLILKLGNKAQKKFYLKRLFPKSDTKKLMNLEASDGFSSLFNASVECIRDETGHVSHYIAKAERAIANLRHFSCDIPNEEVLPLVLTLLREKGHIHPDIINGMVETADTERDKLILQTLFDNDGLNTALLFGQSDDKKSSQSVIQSNGSYGKIETAVYHILHGADKLPVAEQVKYFDTLVGVFEDIQKGLPYQKIIHQAHKRQSPMCRKEFNRNLLQLFSALMTEDMEKRTLTDRLMTYLEREGLPEQLIRRVSKKMNLKNKLMIKVALLRKNRLTLFKSTTKNLLQPYLEIVAGKIAQFRSDYLQNSDTDKVSLVESKANTGQIDRNLPEREINVTNARSNDLVNAMNIMYKKDTEKN